MHRTKIFVALLVISCFLLNSSTVFAWPGGNNTGFMNGKAAWGMKQVLSAKDQAIIEKFDKAQKWFKNIEKSLAQFFNKQFAEFKKKMDQAFQQLKMKFEEFKERTLNKNYTLVQVYKPSIARWETAGYFYADMEPLPAG